MQVSLNGFGNGHIARPAKDDPTTIVMLGDLAGHARKPIGGPAFGRAILRAGIDADAGQAIVMKKLCQLEQILMG